MSHLPMSPEAPVAHASTLRPDAVLLLAAAAAATEQASWTFRLSDGDQSRIPPRCSVQASELSRWMAVRPGDLPSAGAQHVDLVARSVTYTGPLPATVLRRLDEIAVPSDFDQPAPALHATLSARLQALQHPEQALQQAMVRPGVGVPRAKGRVR